MFSLILYHVPVMRTISDYLDPCSIKNMSLSCRELHKYTKHFCKFNYIKSRLNKLLKKIPLVKRHKLLHCVHLYCSGIMQTRSLLEQKTTDQIHEQVLMLLAESLHDNPHMKIDYYIEDKPRIKIDYYIEDKVCKNYKAKECCLRIISPSKTEWVIYQREFKIFEKGTWATIYDCYVSNFNSALLCFSNRNNQNVVYRNWKNCIKIISDIGIEWNIIDFFKILLHISRIKLDLNFICFSPYLFIDELLNEGLRPNRYYPAVIRRYARNFVFHFMKRIYPKKIQYECMITMLKHVIQNQQECFSKKIRKYKTTCFGRVSHLYSHISVTELNARVRIKFDKGHTTWYDIKIHYNNSGTRLLCSCNYSPQLMVTHIKDKKTITKNLCSFGFLLDKNEEYLLQCVFGKEFKGEALLNQLIDFIRENVIHHQISENHFTITPFSK